MSFQYPQIAQNPESLWSITCASGFALFNVTIMDMVLQNLSFLNIYSGSNLIANFSNQNITSPQSIVFNATLLVIELKIMNESETCPSSRFLIYYDGIYKNYIYTPPPPSKNKIVLIVGLCSGIFIIVIIAIIIGFVYYLRHQERYFERLYDILADMKMSPAEIKNFKEKSDQFLIEKGNLHINFDAPLGQGSTSTVYKGRLIGPSPLHLVTKSIETQRYVDCDVAVKVSANFGHSEVEQLYKEIEAMKTIGYHENVMCMLGWFMQGNKPCLVFDIAKSDLLEFVRGFREKPKDEIDMKIFVSILWQVARGRSKFLNIMSTF